MDILGIDVGGSGIKGAPVDTATGRLTAERERIDTPKPATPKAVAKTVAKLAEHFAWRGPIGCAFPARVRRGVAETASNIDKAWIGTDAAALFSEATGTPCTVLNDADAAGLAEITFGAMRGATGTSLLLTVGTGIGSALFIDGHLVPNTEFGHLMLEGRVAEHLASDRARKEDDLKWEAWAERFQRYLVRVEFLLAPDLIVVGGGVSKPKRWEKFAHLLRTQARLVPAALRNEAGIIGAACAAMPKASPVAAHLPA